MTMNKFIILVIGLFSSTLSALIEFPNDSDVSIVGSKMLMNKKELSIWEVKTDLPVSDVTSFYVDLWRGDGEQFGVKDMAQETIVSKLSENILYTAQIGKTFDHTVAIVSASKNPSNEVLRMASKTAKVSRPTGSELLSEIKAKDGAKYSTTLVLRNNHSISRNLSHFNSYIRNDGFFIEESKINKTRDSGFLLARKGPSEFNVTFHKQQGKTYVTAVRVDADVN